MCPCCACDVSCVFTVHDNKIGREKGWTGINLHARKEDTRRFGDTHNVTLQPSMPPHSLYATCNINMTTRWMPLIKSEQVAFQDLFIFCEKAARRNYLLRTTVDSRPAAFRWNASMTTFPRKTVASTYDRRMITAAIIPSVVSLDKSCDVPLACRRHPTKVYLRREHFLMYYRL